MSMHINEEKGGLLHSAAGQMVILGVVLAAILVVAWFYVW